MQAQPTPDLCPKCRAILFRFKSHLTYNKLLLNTHISNVFKYRKDRFSRRQFHKLIRKFDQNLVLSDIDELFQQLDRTGKNYVSFTIFQSILDQISQLDDPNCALERKSVKITNKSMFNTTKILIELKDLLIVNNDQYLQTLELFMTEKDGFLTKNNVLQLLDNLRINDSKKIGSIMNFLFQNKDKIQLKQFLEMLDLDNGGTRIKLQDYSLHQSIILSQQKSKLMLDFQKQYRLSQSNVQYAEYSKILQDFNQMQDNFHSGIYAIEKIPKSLQPYFNYGSQLQPSFANFAQQFIQNDIVFVDEQGPTYGKAAKWVHILQVNPGYFIFETAPSVIYRNDRKGLGRLIQPKDITQGKFGNCYFLSAVAAIVESYPQLMYRLFVLEKNPSHIFGVRLFIDGIWKTIAVDGCFPLTAKGKFCGSQPHHNQIWVLLLQKAWAKVFKTYENIHSGYNQQGLVAVTGAPTLIMLIKDEGILQKIHDQFKKGSIITCTTAKSVSQISIQQQQKLGVFAGHAYTILKIYNDIKIGNQSITLIKMKNPWGSKAWKGDWSFESQKWTNELRSALNFTFDSKDGTFFISLSDFQKYFDHINISKVSLGNRNSHIVVEANRYDFNYNVVNIKQRGLYFFTIYQDNGRKYKNGSGVYQKSPSWLFLAKIDQMSETGHVLAMTAIACNASGYQHSTVEALLQPGYYVVLSKVSWNYWEQHPYVITSYGPAKVQFFPNKTVLLQQIIQFIISRSQQLISSNKCKLTYYKDSKIWKTYYFDHNQGIGFIAICNNDTKIIETTLTLDPCRGLQLLAPFTNPIKIKANPNQIVTAAFIVDPQGYSYKLMQGYKLFIINQQ